MLFHFGIFIKRTENVVWDCEHLRLGSGRCFKSQTKKTHWKVVNGTNNFKATCFHMSDAGKLFNNVGKLIFLGSSSSAESSDCRSRKLKLRLSWPAAGYIWTSSTKRGYSYFQLYEESARVVPLTLDCSNI